jgi:hypothetical protein
MEPEQILAECRDILANADKWPKSLITEGWAWCDWVREAQATIDGECWDEWRWFVEEGKRREAEWRAEDRAFHAAHNPNNFSYAEDNR